MAKQRAEEYFIQWNIHAQIGLRSGGNDMKENKMYNQYFKEVADNCVRKYGYKSGGDEEDEYEGND
jgi:hypothetical protein